MAAVSYLPIELVAQVQKFVRYATRNVSDGVTAVSTTVTSATANFTTADVGAAISGGSIPNGATIASRTNATTVVISAAATEADTGVELTITQTTSNAVDTLETELNTTFGTSAGNVQTFPDTTTGQTSNAVVDVSNNTVFSVPVGNWVGWNNGAWAQYSPAKLASKFTQYLTS